MKEFLIALLGGIGDFDVWLENNSEQECRDVIIPIVRQRDELLAALKEARRWIGDGDMSDGLDRGFWTADYADIADKIDAVISKCEA